MMNENVYFYFASFLRAAKQADWSPEHTDAVLSDAQSADYEHALAVLLDAFDEIDQKPVIS